MNSSLLGRNVRATGFRTRFGAAILAVHRNGERVEGKVGDIELHAGDVLLLEAPRAFLSRHGNDPAFALINEIRGSEPPRHDRANIALGWLLAMIVLSASGVLPLLIAALVAAGGMLATGCLDGPTARRALDVRVLLTIAAAVGVGNALDVSGAADAVATALVSFAAPFGSLALLSAIYLGTVVLAELITRVAAAALMFPLVASVCDSTALPLVPAALVLMLAASASFATPIGSPTNLLVYGPGNYRFADFLRFGIPLSLLVAATVITVANFLWL